MSEQNPVNQISAHYIKTESFDTHYCTGAHGGITVLGEINVNFYIDRPPIPKTITYDISNNQLINPRPSEDSKTGIIREIQTGLVMNIETAKSIRDWLNEHIILAEQIKKY